MRRGVHCRVTSRSAKRDMAARPRPLFNLPEPRRKIPPWRAARRARRGSWTRRGPVRRVGSRSPRYPARSRRSPGSAAGPSVPRPQRFRGVRRLPPRPRPRRPLPDRVPARRAAAWARCGGRFDLKLRVDVALKAVRPDVVGTELRSSRCGRRCGPRARSCPRTSAGSSTSMSSTAASWCRWSTSTAQTLLEVLRERGPLELKEAQDIASQFLAGLEAIHRPGSSTATSSPRTSCSPGPGGWW